MVDWVVVPGVDAESSRAALELAVLYPGRVLATVGLHPHDASLWGEQSDEIFGLAAEASAVPAEPSLVVLRPGRPRFVVRREGERFRVVGRGVERWVSQTDLDDPRKVEALQKKLVREGVERQLARAGARRGDEVVIGDVAFEYIPEEGDGPA